MHAEIADPDRIVELKRELHHSLRDLKIKAAEVAYAELTDGCGLDPESEEMLPSRVMLGIFDSRTLEMLQMLNGLDEDRAPGLKAICLQLLGDPLWEGMAEHLEQTTDDLDIRRSMRSLLNARQT